MVFLYIGVVAGEKTRKYMTDEIKIKNKISDSYDQI